MLTRWAPSLLFYETGVSAVKVSRTRIIARYNETDKMGVVHHSQYLIWFEIARTDWTKLLGLTYRQIETSGLMMPVIGVEVHYHAPARYDDAVIVETSVQAYDSIKMSFHYQVTRESDGKLLADGVTSHCWTNSHMRPVSLRKENPKLHQSIVRAIGR